MQARLAPDRRLYRWQEAIWLLIALLTPLFVNLWVEQQFEASKIWLLRTLVWALALLWLGGLLRGSRTVPLSSTVRGLLIALVLILVLSTFQSPNRSIAIHGTLDRAGGLLTQLSYLLLFVCVATRINARSSRRLLLFVVFTAVPICGLGLAQAAGWQPAPLFTDARSPMTTTLGRANFTGAYLALLLPITLAAAVSATTHRLRWSFAALVVLDLSVIALTHARAAWIAAVVGIGVFVWLSAAPRWPSRVRWLSALGGIATLGAALLLILQRGIAGGGSIAARWTIWRASIDLLRPHLWLGYGADTLELFFPAVYPPQLVYSQGRGVVVDRAHNWLLDWSLNHGIVATLVLIALVGLIVHQGRQQPTAPEQFSLPSFAEQRLGRHWVAACVASVCAMLVGNLFLFDVAATATLFWLLLSILAAAAGAAQSRTESNTQARTQAARSPLPMPAWAGWSALGAGGVIVVWAAWQFNARPLLADVSSRRGTILLSQGNHAAALAQYAESVRYQPHRAAYHVAEALTAAELGDYERAEETMRAAIALRPNDPVLYTQLAAIHAAQANGAPERLDMAYDAYEAAISLGPTIALTFRHYADLALRSGDVALASNRAERAADLDESDGVSYGILGWARLEEHELLAAQRAFEQAVRWQPGSADFHLGLATVYKQLGRLDAARQSLQRSLAIDPAYAPSLSLQIELQGQ